MQDINAKAYFRLLDIVVKETGNSKKSLHEYWLHYIFPFLLEDISNFTTEFNNNYTTKILSSEGWKNFYNEFRHFCLDKFNII